MISNAYTVFCEVSVVFATTIVPEAAPTEQLHVN